MGKAEVSIKLFCSCFQSKNNLRFIIRVILVFIICQTALYSQHEPGIFSVSDSLFSISYYKAYDYIAANEIKMWIGNYGDGSHNPLTDGQGLYPDPDLGDYEGTIQMYNYMQGFRYEGSAFIDPNTGETTKFCLSGDPVSGTGWYEGAGWPGGPPPLDMRYLISSGPFNLTPGDTQEVTIAFLMALGSDNVQSIAALREKAAYVQEFYNKILVREINPPVSPIENFKLEQNYPNPFNSTTTVEYTLPQKSNVIIRIYDILGREVRTFNQGEQVPWHYRVSFNASALASGVYIYRIEAGNFSQSKKMVLLK